MENLEKDKNSLPKFMRNEQDNQVMESEAVVQSPITLYQDDSEDDLEGRFHSEFSKDKNQSRIKRKSTTWLILSSASFAAFIISIIVFNPVAILISAILYIVMTSIYFVIVSSKSYITLSLLVSFVGILILAIATGGINIIAIVVLLFFLIAFWVSYRDVERLQISSRLFFINQITKPGAKILEFLVIVTICFGFFNSVANQGSGKYLSDQIRNNETIQEFLIFPSTGTLVNEGIESLDLFNTYTSFFNANGKKAPTYRQVLRYYYLENNDKLNTGEVLTSDELSLIDPEDNNYAVLKVEREDSKILTFVNERYGREFNEIMDQEMGKNEYLDIVEKEIMVYTDGFGASENEDKSELEDQLSKYVFIPNDFVLPSLLTLIILFFVMIIKYIMNVLRWLLITLTGLSWRMLVWEILKLSGYVRVNIEEVESEVVSI